jgi:hypothetical protein
LLLHVLAFVVPMVAVLLISYAPHL